MIELEQTVERMRYTGNSRYESITGRYVLREALNGASTYSHQWTLRTPEGELLDTDVHLGSLFARNSLALDLSPSTPSAGASAPSQPSLLDKYNELLAAYNAVNLKAVMLPAFDVNRGHGLEASKNNLVNTIDAAVQLIADLERKVRDLEAKLEPEGALRD